MISYSLSNPEYISQDSTSYGLQNDMRFIGPSYINFGNNFNPKGDFSLEFWIYINYHNNSIFYWDKIIQKYNMLSGIGFITSLGDDLSIIFCVSGNRLVSETRLSLFRWYHIFITYSRLSMKIYINGLIDSQIVLSGDKLDIIDNSTNKMSIPNCIKIKKK